MYSKLLGACSDGLANKSTPNYCKKYTVKNENDACLYGFGTALASTPADGTTDAPTANDKPTCGIQGIGWLVCPVMNFMAKLADEAYSFLASYFLTIDTKLISDPQTNAAWARFRDIANVAFVIALIFVVYSQVTSFGISSYGIKRMLPRIIVAALLVNVSFYICAVAVDLSNLLGYAIPQLFKSIPIGAGLPDDGALATAGTALTWVGVVGVVIVGAIGIALAISVPVLIAALLAIGLIVLMLVARQALVILLIVISPLAFVAYLLPNTEQWFKKWYKMLFTLLMLFPVIGTVFGASQLAAGILANAGGGGSSANVTKLIALAVEAIPFFVVPGLLKGSLSAAGAIGTKLQGAANKATGKVGSQVKNTSRLGTGLGEMRKFREQQRAIKLAKGRGKSRSPMGAVGRVVGGKRFNEKAGLRAEGLENQEYEEDVKAATEYQARHTSFGDKQAIAAGTTGASEAERDAAVRFMMSSGNFDERRAVLESIGSMTGGQRRSAINGARSKGDTGVYGSSTLGALEDSTSDGSPSKMTTSEATAALNAGTSKRINTGDLAPETFTRDAYTAKYVAEQSKNATGTAQTQFAQSLTNYAASDQGKKTAASLQGHIDSVVNNAPGSVQPAAPTVLAPAPSNPQPAPQNPSPTTLTVPHGGNPAPTTPPPAAPGAQTPPPGMVQRPSGLFVPSGSNPPPPPPPSNP